MTEDQFALFMAVMAEHHQVLCEIRDALVPAMDEDGPCLHPDDARENLGMTNGAPEWVCRVCKHHEIALPRA